MSQIYWGNHHLIQTDETLTKGHASVFKFLQAASENTQFPHSAATVSFPFLDHAHFSQKTLSEHFRTAWHFILSLLSPLVLGVTPDYQRGIVCFTLDAAFSYICVPP